MSEHETHAKIIAEMHEYAEATDFCAHGNQSVRERMEWMADRAEAAHKHEMKQKYVTDGLIAMHDSQMGTIVRHGDAAKLREAMSKILLWCCEWMRDNTGDQSFREHLGKPIDIAKAALAEPPRNCDRFTGRLAYYESLDAYIKEQEKPTENEDETFLSYEEALDRMNKYREWLFATAKGENK